MRSCLAFSCTSFWCLPSAARHNSHLSSEAFRGLPGLKELHLDGNPRLFNSESFVGALLSPTLLYHPHLIPRDNICKLRVFTLCFGDISTLNGNAYVLFVVHRLSADFCSNISTMTLEGAAKVERVNSPSVGLTVGVVVVLVVISLIVGAVCWRRRTTQQPTSSDTPRPINGFHYSASTLGSLGRDEERIYSLIYHTSNSGLPMNDSGVPKHNTWV